MWGPKVTFSRGAELRRFLGDGEGMPSGVVPRSVLRRRRPGIVIHASGMRFGEGGFDGGRQSLRFVSWCWLRDPSGWVKKVH